MSKLPTVTITTLLDAGVHFGHKTARWNPKMAPYIYGIKDDTHIIDLQQTVTLFNYALKTIYEAVKNNGKILFVGTKIQASDIIAEFAEKCGQFYINHRWLGGMLTNWGTISKSIKTLEDLEKTLGDDEAFESHTKKEILNMTRKREKLLKSLGGIRNIGGKPNLMIVIDTNKEHLAIAEALKLNIPILAIVDSNCNPDNINYPIPGNDDAIRSIKLYCQLFCDAALAGVEDALVASGIDVGAMKNTLSEGKGDHSDNKAGITKLKPAKKTVRHTQSIISAADGKVFEEALTNKENTPTKE